MKINAVLLKGLNDDELVSSAIDGLGLSSLETFEPQQRIIEWALRRDSQ